MCAGCTDSDGYSSESVFGTRPDELKCDGCADRSESNSSSGGIGIDVRDAGRGRFPAGFADLAQGSVRNAGTRP